MTPNFYISLSAAVAPQRSPSVSFYSVVTLFFSHLSFDLPTASFAKMLLLLPVSLNTLLLVPTTAISALLLLPILKCNGCFMLLSKSQINTFFLYLRNLTLKHFKICCPSSLAFLTFPASCLERSYSTFNMTTHPDNLRSKLRNGNCFPIELFSIQLRFIYDRPAPFFCGHKTGRSQVCFRRSEPTN